MDIQKVKKQHQTTIYHHGSSTKEEDCPTITQSSSTAVNVVPSSLIKSSPTNRKATLPSNYQLAVNCLRHHHPASPVELFLRVRKKINHRNLPLLFLDTAVMIGPRRVKHLKRDCFVQYFCKINKM
jgi:hypothetical protein